MSLSRFQKLFLKFLFVYACAFTRFSSFPARRGGGIALQPTDVPTEAAPVLLVEITSMNSLIRSISLLVVEGLLWSLSTTHRMGVSGMISQSFSLPFCKSHISRNTHFRFSSTCRCRIYTNDIHIVVTRENKASVVGSCRPRRRRAHSCTTEHQ